MFSSVRRSSSDAVRLAAALVLFAITGLSGVLVAPAAGAQPAASAGSIRYAVTLASPAVVRIVSVVDGGVICHGCASDGSDIVSPQTGVFEFATSGTGAFISPDGYILTADHVVDHTTNNPDDVASMYQQALQDLAQRAGLQTSDVDAFFQQHANSLEIVVRQKSQQVFLSTAYTGKLQNPSQVVSYAVTRIVASSPVDKQDTAVIKIEASDMPYLSLAPTSAVSAGDSVTSVGFPGDADEVLATSGDFTALLNPGQSDVNTISSLLTASVQTGQVTAQKTLADGTSVYETDGIANHGSSGGPVLDAQGRVVGFVDTGTSASRIVNLISSSVAAEYAQQAGVAAPKPGAFETLWSRAVSEYDAAGACHYTHAASDLKQLQKRYPAFGGADALLADAQAKATSRGCPPPSNSAALLIGGGAGLVLLAGFGAGAFFLIRRKRTAPVAASTSTITAPSTHGQPPMMSNGAVLTLAPTLARMRMAGVSGAVTSFATSSPPASIQAVATTVHLCANGHVARDTSAQVCPHCGGATRELVPQG